MKKSLILLLLVALAVGVGTACGRETPGHDIKTEIPPNTPAQTVNASDEAVYLVGEMDFTPISFMKEGKITGINVDIITEAFKRMNVPVRIELMPWGRCLQMAKDGSADGFFSPFKTAEREELYHYISEPLMVEKNVLAVAKNSGITYDGDIKKMSRYTFGILIGYATLDAYTKDGTITKVEESQTVAEALRKLAAGRGMDIYVNNDLIIRYNAKQEGLTDQITILETPLSEIPTYLAFTKRRDMSALAKQFDETLQAMKADGTYQKIMDTYVGQ